MASSLSTQSVSDALPWAQAHRSVESVLCVLCVGTLDWRCNATSAQTLVYMRAVVLQQVQEVNLLVMCHKKFAKMFGKLGECVCACVCVSARSKCYFAVASSVACLLCSLCTLPGKSSLLKGGDSRLKQQMARSPAGVMQQLSRSMDPRMLAQMGMLPPPHAPHCLPLCMLCADSKSWCAGGASNLMGMMKSMSNMNPADMEGMMGGMGGAGGGGLASMMASMGRGAGGKRRGRK